MANFPSPLAAPNADSMRSPGMPAPVDTSPLARGVAAIAGGVEQAAGALDEVASRQKDQENTVDLARAEAARTWDYIKIQHAFANDPDYSTFADRAEPMIRDAVSKSAELIRDPAMRERWLAQSEAGQIQMLGAVLDAGNGKKMDAERGALITSLSDAGRLISDPSVPRAVRDKAEADIKGSIYMGVQTGLITAEKAAELTDTYVRGSENNLAVNVAQTDIATGHAADVARGMAIPGTNTGQSIMSAQAAVYGTPTLDYDLAKVTAQQIGDANFPADPKEAAAYLSDPGIAQQYAEAAQAHLLSRYKGDLGAVVIAMDPKGGTALADRWMASDHDEAVLPRAVKENYRKVMGSLTAQQPYQRIPIVSDGVDIRMVDQNVLERFERLQSTFGAALPLIPGDKSGPVGDRGVTFDVSKLSDDDKAHLVQMASAMGFTGIGIGKDSIKLTATGGPHAWGPGGQPSDMATSNFDASKGKGLLVPGNIDVNRRQVVHNPDGSISTELSVSFEEDGQEVLVPTVYDGATHSTEEAIQHYRQTGQFLGKFDNADDADAYAEKLHSRKQTFSSTSDIPAWAKDAVADHLAGKTAAIPALMTGVAPEYQALTYDQRLQLYGQAKQAMSQSELTLKTSLQSVVDNAPAAYAATGKYDGVMPTALDFVQAYGAVDGMRQFQAFDRAVDSSKLIYQMRTMSNDDIEKALQTQAPLTSGNTAKLDADRYQALQTAAASVLKARADDPAGYAASAFPAVQQAWDAAGKDPSQIGAALTVSMEAQKTLGIDAPALLPKGMADAAVSAFKDTTKPAQERMGGVASLVLANKDPMVQKAVFDQLLDAGLPAMTQGVVAAMTRGDTEAATTLMRAALIDPTKMGPKFSDEATTAKVADELQAQVFAPGMIGDVIYGTTGGTPDSLERVGADITLMDRAAKLRLIDGSAKDAAEAVRLTIKDMYGDVQVVTGKGGGPFGIGAGTNLKVTLPADASADQARAGFNAVTPLVRDAVSKAMLTRMIPWRMSAGDAAQTRIAAQTQTDLTLSEGWFENAGDGQFTFYDPYTDAAVPSGKTGPDGAPLPLVFTLDQVMSYGKPLPGPEQLGGVY